MSMGWADNILLAMGPVGIMTVIVRAIRVGGVKQLKALVGRAGGSQSTAEQEPLSSTSDDVFYDLQAAHKEGLLSEVGRLEHELGDEAAISLNDTAPNLGLNVKNTTAPSWELWLWASVGVILQLVALATQGAATYYWQWDKGGAPIPTYGYPCFLLGTLMVIVGVMGCGHVMEGITKETTFLHRFPGSKTLRLQPACTVSDQKFSSYAIFNSADNVEIRFSRRDETNQKRFRQLL